MHLNRTKDDKSNDRGGLYNGLWNLLFRSMYCQYMNQQILHL